MRDRPVDFSSSDVVVVCQFCFGRISISDEEPRNYESVVECLQCGASVGYDDRSLVRTNPDDPVRAAEAVPTVSWFHSSTYEQWPPMVAAERDHAMHLGTYEAAIDTMYHRMDKMSDTTRQFFLHRVTIDPTAAIDPLVHPDRASWLSGFVDLSVVTDGGHSIRRYINGAEHRGSISLAISLEAIAEVQTIAIPVLDHRMAEDHWAATADAEHAAEIARATDEHDAALAAYIADGSPIESPDDPIRQKIKDILGKSRRGAITSARDIRKHAADAELDAQLSSRYLAPGVSVERREAVASALARRVRETGDSLHALYREHSPLMTAPGAVLDALRAQPAYRSPVLDVSP